MALERRKPQGVRKADWEHNFKNSEKKVPYEIKVGNKSTELFRVLNAFYPSLWTFYVKWPDCQVVTLIPSFNSEGKQNFLRCVQSLFLSSNSFFPHNQW